jgi:dephospho-CoA kinase
MILVGLTGSLGSGKSTCSGLFEELGVPCLDADVFARRAVIPGSEALRALQAAFGREIINSDGTLKRAALAEGIFNNSEKRRLAESIIHPQVERLFQEALAGVRTASPAAVYAIYAVPLLFETGRLERFDRIVVVSVPRETSLQRVMQRDGCQREMAEKRYDSQLPPEEKMKRADFVINNQDGIEDLRRQVRQVHTRLLAEFAQGRS